MNSNIEKFAQELTNITGVNITVDHIHPQTTGREYYVQAPISGAPMLLHHYRGPFFVDIHPNDYEKMERGEISPNEYIATANWQVGYYWGGGSIYGGYYQPLDIVGRQEEVKRYLKILSCRGARNSSGYQASEERCSKCSVEACPFSRYKIGFWENELQEPDNRQVFYKAFYKSFEEEHPDYIIRGFLPSNTVRDDTIVLIPNCRYEEEETQNLHIYVSNNLVRDILMHKVVTENWDEYAKKFRLVLKRPFSEEEFEVTEENLKKLCSEQDRIKKEEKLPTIEDNSTSSNIFKKIIGFFFKK